MHDDRRLHHGMILFLGHVLVDMVEVVGRVEALRFREDFSVRISFEHGIDKGGTTSVCMVVCSVVGITQLIQGC